MTTLQTADMVLDGLVGGGWGLGWEVIRKPVGPAALYSVGTFLHGGARGTLGLVDPDKDMVCLFMMQRTPGPNIDEEIQLFQVMAAAVLD